MQLEPSPSQTSGPYFHLGCTDTHSVSCLIGEKAKGERIRLILRIVDGEGSPVNDAMIEVWQANSEGTYRHPDDPRDPGSSDCSGYGRLATDENGTGIFETIKPGRVPGNGGTLQAPHLNVSVFARGIMKRLATRIYFAHDPANPDDPILALVPGERRETLMAKQDPHKPGDWSFTVRLCGEGETVFFDI